MSNIDFLYIGNNLAVDLVNTQIVSRGQKVDLLQDKGDFVRWLTAAKLTVDQHQLADITELLELRKALSNTFMAKINQLAAPVEALTIINRYLRGHTRTTWPRLPGLLEHWPDSDGRDGLSRCAREIRHGNPTR